MLCFHSNVRTSTADYKSYSDEEIPPPKAMCRETTELCLPYGNYRCCKGLDCILGNPDLPGAVGVCTPLGEQPQPPKDKCRKRHQICVHYGEYNCCHGLHCVDTDQLFPGAGLCE